MCFKKHDKLINWFSHNFYILQYKYKLSLQMFVLLSTLITNCDLCLYSWFFFNCCKFCTINQKYWSWSYFYENIFIFYKTKITWITYDYIGFLYSFFFFSSILSTYFLFVWSDMFLRTGDMYCRHPLAVIMDEGGLWILLFWVLAHRNHYRLWYLSRANAYLWNHHLDPLWKMSFGTYNMQPKSRPLLTLIINQMLHHSCKFAGSVQHERSLLKFATHKVCLHLGHLS